MEKVTLAGAIEGDYRWSEHNDVTDTTSDSTSDLFIRTMELGAEADFTAWIKGSLVLLAEDLGTDDETDVSVDEAVMTIQSEGFPVYLILGKRVQPFGFFENHLVSDPMTQDAYETNRAGVTVGLTGPRALDFSATLYKGEEMMNHFFESGLFNTDTAAGGISREGEGSDDVGSYIVSLSLSPMEDHITLFGAYISETGNRERNVTVNAGFSFIPPGLKNIRIDAEYMKALSREKYDGAGREYKEGMFSIAVAYEVVLRKKQITGDVLLAESRGREMSGPLEFAVRYEHFDDDGMAEGAGTWTVDNRYSAGTGYSFYYDEESGLTAYIAAEFRLTKYREITDSIDKNNEFLARLGLSF
ncbi:MAG: LbtU family siderophore porin [Nitrospirota bacterium]|nr:LbtU family siderophore porin [Nitrospirota bacterium]